MMSRIPAYLLAFFVVAQLARPAQASISFGEVLEDFNLSASAFIHLVGTSADEHQVDARIDTSYPLFILAVVAPGQTIPLRGSDISWAGGGEGQFGNAGLSVDGTSYPGAFVDPVLSPIGATGFGQPVNDNVFFTGSAIAPAAPSDPTVRQTVTISAPFAYSGIEFMESLVNPFNSGGPWSLVNPLFVFNEPGGTGIANLTLGWDPPNYPGESGVWEVDVRDYTLSSATPEPSTFIAWSLLGTMCTVLWRRKRPDSIV